MEINQSTTSNTVGLPLGNGQKPGERLRQVRLSQKRELGDVSAELHIPQHILLALEADDYAALPQVAFVRGYLRSYAKFLGIDANALVSRFNDIYASDTGRATTQALADSPLKPLAKISSKQHKRNWRWVRWAVLLVLLLTMLYALVQWLSRTEDKAASPADPVSSSLPVPIVPSPVEVLPIPQVTAQNNSLATTLPIQATAVNQMDRLVIALSRPAIVLVKDATGKELVSGQQAASQPLQIDGQSPFSITLPEAEAVQQLSLNGEQVGLSSYIVNGRADFRLSR